MLANMCYWASPVTRCGTRLMSKLHVLHLEDNATDAEQVRSTLAQENIDCAIDRVATEADFQSSLKTRTYDLILSDFAVPGFDGLAALAMAKKLSPEVPFLLLSGAIGEERVVESLKSGAVDYVRKDRLQRLSSTVLRAHHEANERRERQKNENQIHQQAELLNHARDAIFVRNLDHVITYWNKGAERIYGWTAAEAVGKMAGDLLYKPGSPKRGNIWETVLEKGEWTGEIMQVTNAGREIFVMSRRTLLRDTFEAPVGILNINTDITEKRGMEIQLMRSQRMDKLGALAGGIAHDLNNVLAPILMATEILHDQVRAPEDLSMVDFAQSSARRGIELVKQILQFAQGTKSEGTTKVKSVVEELVSLMRKTFPHSLEFKTDVQMDVLPVLCDPTHLYQIILNLCVNARDAMPAGGTLSVQVNNIVLTERQMPGRKEPVSGSFVEVAVSDTGTGIPPEIRAKIFEPFFTTKPEGKGTGLGLSTVATIVRNFQGFLDVSTVIGEGTTFRVFLPAMLSTSAPQKQTMASDAMFGDGKWVLLVDDEIVLLEMTREILQAHGFQVMTATDGMEALTCFKLHPDKYAVVITDMLMPGLAGDTLLSGIREISPGTITICLSGSPDEAGLHARHARADAFLPKPCTTKDLLSTLQELLSKSRTLHYG
jgi:two-component system cell cycle sensor histidine kinase/response regulator CckA